MREKKEEDAYEIPLDIDASMAERRRRAAHNDALEARLAYREEVKNIPGCCVIDCYRDKHGDGSYTEYFTSRHVPIEELPNFILQNLDTKMEILVYATVCPEQAAVPGSGLKLGLRLDMRQYIYMVRAAKKELERELEKEQKAKARSEESGGFGDGILDMSGPGGRR